MSALKLEKVERPMGYRKCHDCGSGTPRYRMSMIDYPVMDEEGQQIHVCAPCAKKMEALWASCRNI